MTRVTAVLLDKDGTLVDFQSYWIPISEVLVELLVRRLGLDDTDGAIQKRLLRSIGIDGTVILPGTPVASGTGRDVAVALSAALDEGSLAPQTIRDWMDQDYRSMASEFEGLMTPYPGARASIERLAAAGMVLGVATADTSGSARYALGKLDLTEYFSFAGGSDLVSTQKPDPELAHLFCESVGVPAHQVAMVGDTPVDMEFAKNAGMGLAIGVLTGVGTREQLEPLADVVVDSVADLADLLLAGVGLP